MIADLAVPGGPCRNRCSPATTARAINSITSSLPTKRRFSGSITCPRNRATVSSGLGMLFLVRFGRGQFKALALVDQFEVLPGSAARRPRGPGSVGQALGVKQHEA